MTERSHEAARTWPHRLLRTAGATALYVGVSGGLAAYFYENGQADSVVATTESTIEPTLDGTLTIKPGVLIPDLRADLDMLDIETPFHQGAEITMGNTLIPPKSNAADNLNEIIASVSSIVAQPSGEIENVTDSLKELAVDSAKKGAAIAAVPFAVYGLLGQRRRKELLEEATHERWRAVRMATVLALLVPVATASGANTTESRNDGWVPLVQVVPELSDVSAAEAFEIRSNALTGLARDAVQGVFESYESSLVFYINLEQAARDIAPQLRMPEEGETVGVLVSDRHNNIQMDPPVRAIADGVGAKYLFNAGDDTSSGSTWEEFSPRSVVTEFKGMKIVVSPGNHDNGEMVSEYYSRHNVTVTDGTVFKLDDITVAGGPDPRSSGYTQARIDGKKTVEQVNEELADTVCASKDRVGLLLVHDRDMGSESLARGCVDLVVSGHEHVQYGPTDVVGENGETGYDFTNGTTGGAVYSMALIGRIKRDAMITLITFRDGRPVGLQPVTFGTNGVISVAEYEPLEYPEPESTTSNEVSTTPTPQQEAMRFKTEVLTSTLS